MYHPRERKFLLIENEARLLLTQAIKQIQIQKMKNKKKLQQMKKPNKYPLTHHLFLLKASLNSQLFPSLIRTLLSIITLNLKPLLLVELFKK